MQLTLDAHTRKLPGCTLKVKNPLTDEERRVIHARIEVLEKALIENERQRWLWAGVLKLHDQMAVKAAAMRRFRSKHKRAA